MNSSLEKPTSLESIPVKTENLSTKEHQESVALNPKTILDDLKKRAETATSKEERDRFRGLAEQLMRSFEIKSEKMVDGTKDELARLNSSISPSQQKLLQDAKVALESGAGKIASISQETVSSTKEIGGKAVEAIKSGDIKEATKLMEGVKESINAAGQKVMEYSGVKALEKVLEPLKTGGVMGIFAVLSNIWKFLMGGMKWSEIVGEAGAGVWEKGKEVLDGGKKTTQKKPGQAESALESFWKMSPVEIEKLTTKMVDEVANDLSQTYLGWAKLSDDKIKKIREIITSTNLNPEELQKISKNIQESGKITVENLAQILGTLSTGATELMWKIAFSGIVPLKHIVYEAVSSGSKTAVGLTFHGLWLPPMTMTIEEIHTLISKHSANWGEKAMSLVQLELYRPLGVFWAVTSGIIANIAKLGIAAWVDTANGANGYSVLRWLTWAGGDYHLVFKEFELINQKFANLPNNPHTQWMAKIIEELKTAMNIATKNWKIISVLDEVKYDKAKFLAHPELSKVLDATEIVKIKQAQNFQTALKEVVWAPPARSLEIKNLRMFFGNGDGVIQKYLRDIDNVRWFQNLLVSSDKGGIEKINRLRDFVNTMKLIRQGDTVLLHLEDAKDVKNFQELRKLLAVFPEWIRWLGSILPAGAFVVTMSNVVSDEATSSSEIMESLKTVLVPMVWGWQLIKNVGVNFEDLKNGKLPTLSDAGIAALGMTIITFEGIRIAGGLNEAAVKVFRHGDIKWAAWTVAKTAFMHPIDIAKSLGYASRWAMHAARATPAMYSQTAKLLMQVAEKIPKKGKLAILAWWLVATATTWATILDNKDHLELEFDLKKQGYIDAKGNLTQKFYVEFLNKSTLAKREILCNLFWALVDTSEKRPKIHFDESNKEFAIVTSKSQEKSWWQNVLDTDTLFRDQLMCMGIDVVVISTDDISKPIEQRKEKVL